MDEKLGHFEVILWSVDKIQKELDDLKGWINLQIFEARQASGSGTGSVSGSRNVDDDDIRIRNESCEVEVVVKDEVDEEEDDGNDDMDFAEAVGDENEAERASIYFEGNDDEIVEYQEQVSDSDILPESESPKSSYQMSLRGQRKRLNTNTPTTPMKKDKKKKTRQNPKAKKSNPVPVPALGPAISQIQGQDRGHSGHHFNITIRNPEIDNYDWTQDFLEVKRKGQKSKYKCNSCGKSITKAYLLPHRSIHTGDKPYVCAYDNCGNCFRSTEELRRHTRLHTGEEPFPCRFPCCGRSFRLYYSRKKHEESHKD